MDVATISLDLFKRLVDEDIDNLLTCSSSTEEFELELPVSNETSQLELIDDKCNEQVNKYESYQTGTSFTTCTKSPALSD